MSDSNNIKETAIKIIESYLGAQTADLYKNFYIKLEDRVVIDSLQELLSEYVGQESVDEIFNKHSLTKNSYE